MRSGKIDVIVVYKVDRLTRSLADFAKLVELFDEHNVSFVSVTQQFNTTTSMARLTLNVLLSFAQFEREVTSERIRDKISASKRKGLSMPRLVTPCTAIGFGIAAAPSKIDKPSPWRGRSLMHGVAPQCAVKVSRPSLGGEAGGRSPGFISRSVCPRRREVAAISNHFCWTIKGRQARLPDARGDQLQC